MTQKILAHFKKVDPIMYTAIQRLKLETPNPVATQQYFHNLCRAIVGQQLAGKAAAAIFERFRELFSGKRVTPKAVLAVSEDTIRGAGLSWAKVWSIKDLAQKVSSREVKLRELKNMGDAEVIEELTKVRGIGPWTAEMFLMFNLGRDDIFSAGDLGLRKGMEELYKLTNPTQEKLLAIAKKWSPYRSWGSRALWRVLDGPK